MKKYENDEDDYYYADNEYLLENWTNCQFDREDARYKNCTNCEYYDDCLEEADDNRDSYAAFEDLILESGYDSMDDFWESNI